MKKIATMSKNSVCGRVGYFQMEAVTGCLARNCVYMVNGIIESVDSISRDGPDMPYT